MFIETVFKRALPLWRNQGFDAATGLFRERLSLNGDPLATPLRTMVQARQIYVYALASVVGLGNEGLEQAITAMRRLRTVLGGEDIATQGFAFSADAQGRGIGSDVRDAYTHAFLLLAAALLYRATGERDLLTLIQALTRFIDARLMDDDHDGLHDRWPPAVQPTKRQNPQMHLLEAYVALEQALPDHGYTERIDRIVGLFHRRMFDHRRAILVEHFAADWTAHPESARQSLFEPGHHYEWVWLLAEVERLSGRSFAAEGRMLFETARESGHAPHGLIYDELDAARRIVSASHRLWPHTEAIKAAAARHAAGDSDARPFAEHMAGLLCRHFLSQPFAGGWIDHLHPDCMPRVGYVPASSLYHLFLAATEARRVFHRPVGHVDRDTSSL